MNQTDNDTNGASANQFSTSRLNKDATCQESGGLIGRLFKIFLALLIVAVIFLFLTPSVRRISPDKMGRSISANQLKQLGIAMHNFYDANDALPAEAIYSRDGKPLLSWRVAILPYLEQASLYKEFHLDEPWDSPNNLPLLAKMPKVYRLPFKGSDSNTYYRSFHGTGAAFEGKLGLKLTDFNDGASSTLLVFEAGESVPWTKPEEFEYAPNSPLPHFEGHWKGVFHVLLVDGSVHAIKVEGNEQNIRKAILRNDGQVPEWSDASR